MISSILSIGDELLIGQVVNTNASWLGDRLTDRGVAVDAVVTIGDDRGRIAAEIARLAGQCDILFVSGGLGPTEDDLTREAICDLLTCELVLDGEQLARIERRFARAGVVLNERSRHQALVPSACRTLSNEYGSAPGLEFSLGGTRIIVLPGVPTEFRGILEDNVLGWLRGAEAFERTTFLLFGPPESELANRMAELNPLIGGSVTRAFLPSPGGIRVRVLRSGGGEEAACRYQQVLDGIRRLAGEWLVSERDESLASAVGRALRERGRMLATAESCTGGLLGKLLTDVPGSSAYYLGGIVSYANEAKASLLAVEPETIDQHGAVSGEVAEAMARGVLAALPADIGVAITGVAGPEGGTEDKPVGTTWIALASVRGVRSQMFRIGGERDVVRLRAANLALNLVRLEVLELGSGLRG